MGRNRSRHRYNSCQYREPMAHETRVTTAKDASHVPPRSEGIAPLPAARSAQREGAEGRDSKPDCAGLDGLKSCRLQRQAPRDIAAQRGVLHIHRRSLCSKARPMALGTKAMASPAADKTTPVLITLQVTNVPTA
ncbi:hypothetical protein CLU85_0627 [Acidovorax sp. 69]|nr:hypothetical protein CLU85_0627 [Acidovorax sp. 69]